MNGFYQKLFPTTFVMTVCALVFTASCTKSVDPFLGDLKPNSHKVNKKNFDEFTGALLKGCYVQWNWYEKTDGNRWIFRDWAVDPIGGNAGQYFLMTDSETLLQYTINISLCPALEEFTKYTVAYDAETGTISMTEILPDGTNGKTYSSTLLSGAPRPVIEGPFGGMFYIRIADDDSLINLDIRWCFKECDDRAEILEKYEKWLSEQEK